MQARDRHLAQELVYGVVRSEATLDWLIARKVRQAALKPNLRNLLRLGLYQIFWLDRIPPHAAVHETVEASKRAGYGRQAAFINALLRSYLRDFEPTKELLRQLQVTQPHLGFSHPEWLVQRWQQRFGLERTRELLAWNNQPPKLFGRVNTLKSEAGTLLQRWRNEHVEYDFVRRDWLEDNLVFELKAHPFLESLRTFREGLFYVQDPSTLLAVKALAPRPGENILDLCAAPGGKLTYAAQIMLNKGQILAYDNSPERLKLLEENCARLGVTCVKPVTNAAALVFRGLKFDRALVDAPCSNTGVLRRRVDLRWRIRREELDRLRKVQGELLIQAAALLKPGGTLVYSTCSLEPDENAEMIAEFVQDHHRFRISSERELLPFQDQVDGAYVAILKHS